jgi:hypothetical protein
MARVAWLHEGMDFRLGCYQHRLVDHGDRWVPEHNGFRHLPLYAIDPIICRSLYLI